MKTYSTLAESLNAHQWELEKALQKLKEVAQCDDDEAYERCVYKVSNLRKRIQEINAAIASGQV